MNVAVAENGSVQREQALAANSERPALRQHLNPAFVVTDHVFKSQCVEKSVGLPLDSR